MKGLILSVITTLVSTQAIAGENFNVRSGNISCSERYDDKSSDKWVPTMEVYSEFNESFAGDDSAKVGFRFVIPLGKPPPRQTFSSRCDYAVRASNDTQALDLELMRLRIAKERLELERSQFELDQRKRNELSSKETVEW